MSEWWTYRPSDFLMFAPRIYWRLFESINAAVWPWQAVIVAAVVWWAWRGGRGRPAALTALGLAAMFALCAWAFHRERFAPIFWVAEIYGWAFGAQALLLVGLTLRGGGVDARFADPPHARVAGALALWTVIGHPLLTPIAARPWTQAEWPGLAPDPTAILALAFLLRMPRAPSGWPRVLQRAAWVMPMMWCVVSAATLATMGEWQALVMLAAPAVAMLVTMNKGRSGAQPLRP